MGAGCARPRRRAFRGVKDPQGDPRTDPRLLALDALVRAESGAFLDAIVGDTLAGRALDGRDAALFTRLAYGTTAWQGRLDWTLARLVDRPLARLDPPIRAALRLGLYQLFHLDRVPAHAAVDATVRAARRHAGRSGAGLVNAVLRRAAREGERPLPRGKDLAVRLAVEWSHPEWLVHRWLDEIGEEAAARRLAADNEAAPTVLRIDPRETTREEALRALAARGLDVAPTTYAPHGIVFRDPLARLGREEGAAQRLGFRLTPQGEASQLVAELLAAAPDERVLDACAAPGGKTGVSAERQCGRGLLVAADVSLAGLRIARSRAAATAVLAVVADGTTPPFRDATFDAALVDAPCSGLGTLRAHPEIRWRRHPDDLARHGALQATLLARTAACVRPGGRLVYATCTLAHEENEDVVARFLAEHASWRRTDAAAFLPPAAAPLVDADGALRTAPERDGLDGFFAVRLERAS